MTSMPWTLLLTDMPGQPMSLNHPLYDIHAMGVTAYGQVRNPSRVGAEGSGTLAVHMAMPDNPEMSHKYSYTDIVDLTMFTPDAPGDLVKIKGTDPLSVRCSRPTRSVHLISISVTFSITSAWVTPRSTGLRRASR